MSIVYTGGTFDLFHSGHVNFLRQCYGIAKLTYRWNIGGWKLPPEKVVVSLNTDEFIKKYKGKAPIYSYKERKELLEGCKYVAEVIPNIGGTDSKPAILTVKPDFIAIGTDWACKDYYAQMGFTQDWLDKQSIQLVYFPYTEGVSTTELKDRITGNTSTCLCGGGCCK